MTDDRERTPDESAADETTDQVTPAANGVEEAQADAVGAYLLDALDDAERSAFETYLEQSPEAQAELQRLAPVVALLPKLFESDAAAPAPTAELRERIIEAATTEAVETAGSQVRTVRTAPEHAGSAKPVRRAQRPPTRTGPRPTPTPIVALRRFPASWLAAAGLTIIAVGAIFWALALQGKIDNKNREIAAQRTQIAAKDQELAGLRENANATSFTLSATADEPAGATGTVLYSLQDQIGVLYVRNMAELEEALVYQLWYLDDESDAPRPGGTFRVDSNGAGFVVVDSDTPVFDGLAITVEPEGGSQAPTNAVIMSGRLGGARG